MKCPRCQSSLISYDMCLKCGEIFTPEGFAAFKGEKIGDKIENLREKWRKASKVYREKNLEASRQRCRNYQRNRRLVQT